MPQNPDPSFWALLTGLPLLALFVLALFARRRMQEKAGLAGTPPPTAPQAAPEQPTPRRRPVVTAPPASKQELTSALRSAILRTAAERAPQDWTILVLCPPSSSPRPVWHVHLAAQVALDVPDGRSVPVNPPTPTHAWQFAGGRRVGVSDGDPEPAPSGETQAIRVTGPYLQVVLVSVAGQPAELVARVEGSPDGSPEFRAAAADLRACQAALRDGVELAVGTRLHGSPPTLGYSLKAWGGHDRVWLTIGQ
ncbi:MAG: hypothetical protein IT306_26230 [Chloroflexi bacterium]|nr:hypothetical protein [Chloroflexota bacterium]